MRGQYKEGDKERARDIRNMEKKLNVKVTRVEYGRVIDKDQPRGV